MIWALRGRGHGILFRVMQEKLGLLASTENATSVQNGTKLLEFVTNLSTCQMLLYHVFLEYLHQFVQKSSISSYKYS